MGNVPVKWLGKPFPLTFRMLAKGEKSSWDIQDTVPWTEILAVESHVNPSKLIHGAFPGGFGLFGTVQA